MNRTSAQHEKQNGLPLSFDTRARVAVDLGAESCRVSLLRWRDGQPIMELLHRIPNGPIAYGGTLRWPLDQIVSGVDEGLRKAAAAAPEGIASIAVDGWAVDYVRLDEAGHALGAPFCYRDERTVPSKAAADRLAPPESVFHSTGAQPLRINTLYQLLADQATEVEPHEPWLCIPEYILHCLGARPVAEYTNATHTGLVDLRTGGWCEPLIDLFHLDRGSFPPIVPPGSVIGRLHGPLATLPAFRETNLIAPACHDTASAVAAIADFPQGTAYICSGTWSLVGTLIDQPIATTEAMAAGFTNLGAAGGGYCFHTNVNGLWMLKQCMDSWAIAGRAWTIEELLAEAERCSPLPGTIPVSAPALLLAGNMPERINEQLHLSGRNAIDDTPGNEPLFARLILESLAAQYASTLRTLERLLDSPIHRIHLLGGGSLNRLLLRLTEEKTGIPVKRGHAEGSTMGNFAIQLATADAGGSPIRRESIQSWAKRLTTPANLPRPAANPL
jgi:rhamnulokinase